jgi:hypothetical protein
VHKDNGELGWWPRLVYLDPTPASELKACHLVKQHITLARHLWTDHDIRFTKQVGLPGLLVLHDHLHKGE